MKRIALFSALAGLSAGPALAADLPSRYQPAPYYAPTPAPIFTWSGFYAGVNGQIGVGSFTGGGGQVFGTPFGGLGGGTIGYNYQSGQLLVGGEADIAFGSISGTGNFGAGTNGSGAINGLGTIRGRLGYVWDRTLIYATGGYAGTVLNGKLGDYNGSPNLQLSEGHYLSGYAVGLGAEFAVTTRISVKAEYLFTGFGQQTYFSGTRDAISSGADISLIRAGLNYHF
jgi:outer membrane immunogenic protein